MSARRLVLLLLPLFSCRRLAGRPPAQLQQFPTAPLTIVTAGGPRKFTVELATTPASWSRG